MVDPGADRGASGSAAAGASGFITNDEQLRQVAHEGIEMLLLDDLLKEDTIPE